MSTTTGTPAACRICLVRHGETSWNTERRLQGHIDIPLNDRGRAQAASTARSLAAQGFDALYSSDLQRAYATAQAIAAGRPQPLREDPRLRERHYGDFQGLRYDEASARFPEAYARFTAREPDHPLPGGESLAAFAARVSQALGEIARRHAGGRVLVVTHGGVLDIAHRLAAGKPLHAPRDFTIPNAALNWIEHGAGGWCLIAWADERHLAEALDDLPNA